MSDDGIEEKVAKQLVELVSDWQDCLILAEEDEDKGRDARERFKDRIVPAMAKLIIATVRADSASAPKQPKPADALPGA
jgi:hypothetical protein